MKKIILEIKGKRYSLKEVVPNVAKKFMAEGLKLAMDIVESQLHRHTNKHVRQFAKDVIANLRIEQSRYIHEDTEVLEENALSAKRTLRRALRMIIDEYKRNIKNSDVHQALEGAIAHLKQDVQAIEALDQPGGGEANDFGLADQEPLDV